MNKGRLREIEEEDDFVELLKAHGLFREDDVTFDDLAAFRMYVYTGDDFEIDPDLFAELGLGALLVEGAVRTEYLRVSDIVSDCGVFCVTGDVRCKDLLYMTETTGVGVAGSLVIDNIFYADCGNSVLQVNKDLSARLLFNSQCDIEVAGRKTVEHDESLTKEDLASLGIAVSDDKSTDQLVRAYFHRYNK